MRIASWNLNHRIREKKIPDSLIKGVNGLNLDVLVLTEYVDGHSRSRFKNSLKASGFTNIRISEKVVGQNQVLIASKVTQKTGDISPPTYTDAARTNFLHTVLTGSSLEIVGVRPPAYKTRADLKCYWEELGEIIQRTRDRNIVFIGDFNCDPFRSNTPGSKTMNSLKAFGFHIPEPDGPWSYISINGDSCTSIDHAVLSSSVWYTHAKYVYNFEDIVFAGPKRQNPISDHAMLILELG